MSAVFLTAGETMALLDPREDGAPRAGSEFALRVAGAESNVAIGLARLGVGARWVSRLGDDALGAAVRSALAGEGLDLGFVRSDADAPTGLFFKTRREGRVEVVYYRSGSAASRLSPADVPDAALAGVRLVHLTGITLGLSESCAELVVDLARRARRSGAAVVFDPNYRTALWESPAAALEAQRPLFGLVDWYLCGAGEGGLLLGVESAGEVVRALRAAGVERSAVRDAGGRTLVATADGVDEVETAAAGAVRDEVGAGDGFAAGFAFGLLRGWEPRRCARAGQLIAGWALRGTGDWETLPRLDEVAGELGV